VTIFTLAPSAGCRWLDLGAEAAGISIPDIPLSAARTGTAGKIKIDSAAAAAVLLFIKPPVSISAM
jgi:hypothetical protein